MRWLLLLSLLAVTCSGEPARDEAPLRIALAERMKPGPDGAMGRNRSGYFHARFQMGGHHLARLAVEAGNADALEGFLRSLEYAFAHQTPEGGFEVVIPEGLEGRPSPTDLASGTAFFLSSAGDGLRRLERSEPLPIDAKTQARIEAIEAKLPASLDYLRTHRDLLAEADRLAPNRLLINALAFLTLGDPAEAKRFVDLALSLIHEDGYFIEGGGYDSSYNGVALAIAYRIHEIAPDLISRTVLEQATAWQLTRLADTGEILTEGNARVSAEGESFLGRKKDVDVAHTLEALLAAGELESAHRVYRFYQK